MKISARLLIILAAIILFGAGFLTGANTNKEVPTAPAAPVTKEEQKAQIVNVLIDTGADLLGFPNIEINANDTVWSVLERLSKRQPELAVASEQYPELGVLVKSIKGVTNGTEGKYWQYWVNNKYAEVAADKMSVTGGEVIMWKFTKAQFREVN